MSREKSKLQAHWEKERGTNPEYYSAAFEVVRIAKDLELEPSQVNGALTHLHQKRKVIGYRVRNSQNKDTYVVALR